MSAPPLGKYLASSDKKTRDRAVQHLADFLSNPDNDALPDVEIAKLWKGLFYCFWMSDKPRVQQALAQELAELLLTITSVPSALGFLRGFWTATVREWNGIDRLRMDKYYMLVRRFVNASFRLLLRTKWDPSSLEEYNAILTNPGGPLCPADVRVPAGLTFHLSEIYLEELEKAFSVVESPDPVPILALLSPFVSLAAHTPTKTTYKHLEASLFQPFLDALRTPSPRDQSRVSGSEYPAVLANVCADSDGPITPSTLRKAVLRNLFSVASAEDTRDTNRRWMYALYKTAIEEDEDSAG